ncbi:MAG TPA: SEC-C metal-binding domain-containing protein [Candidatus Paceibacterota bacterium]|nr:SEC-C metal-binding domain-containing protein [Candidatus Paceibacterota bacterium]
MDTRTGEIYEEEKMKKMFVDKEVSKEEQEKYFKRMQNAPTAKQMARKPSKVGRNEQCPCGSGLKFKKCCLQKEGT